MGRSESKAAGNQASSIASTNNAQAGQAYASGNQAVANLNQEGYNKWKRDHDLFQPGGEFAQTLQGNEAAATQGGKESNEDFLHDYAVKTGLGPTTSQMTSASEEAARQNERDMAAMARQDELARLAGLDSANQDYVNTLQQVAADYGGYYAPGVSGATGQVGNYTNAAKTPGFWDTFGHDIAAAGGQVAAGFAGCWIAAEVFNGWHDPRTIIVREWLNTEFVKSAGGKLVMVAYLCVGRQSAALIRRFPILKRIFLPLFNRALAKASAAKAGK